MMTTIGYLYAGHLLSASCVAAAAAAGAAANVTGSVRLHLIDYGTYASTHCSNRRMRSTVFTRCSEIQDKLLEKYQSIRLIL